MSKRRILVFIFLVLLEIFYSSVYISEHKRSLETLEFQKDGKPIEDADEIPQEAKALMEEYREAKQSEILYIKVSRVTKVLLDLAEEDKFDPITGESLRFIGSNFRKELYFI